MPQMNYGMYQGNQQVPGTQFPYGTNNLIMNSPYDNYMGKQVQQNLSTQYLKCRPVASKDQARAAQIDLDGSLWVFTDVANGKIYTKQINNDGTAAFKTYIFTEESETSYNSSEYVTKEEFNRVIQTLVASMNNNKDEGNNNTNKQPSPSKNDNVTGFYFDGGK